MVSHSAAQAKKQIRSHIRRERRQMDPDQRKQETDAILRHVMSAKPYHKDASAGQRTLLFYMPMPEEVNIIPLIEHALLSGERVLLPRVAVDSREMTLHIIQLLADLEEKRSGWFEPYIHSPQWRIEDGLDGVIIPGIAFDRSGGRIGYGGGYYDTLLQHMAGSEDKPWILAPAFNLQLVDEIPREPHDQPIDFIATGSGIISCQANQK